MNGNRIRYAVALGLLFASAVVAQDTPKVASGTTPLGVRQQRVERMMEDLERKFKVLAQTLQKTEPERAERIVKTLQESKQLLIQQRMDEITKLLDQSQLEGATTGQTQVLGDIRKLIALLLDEQNDRDKIREEYERLDEWKKEIENILEEERPQKAESERLANKEKTLADLAAQIKAVEELIKQQEALNQRTGEARAEGIQALGKSAGEQGKVREQTEKTADMIAGKPAENPAGRKESAKPDTGDKPSGDKPAGDKPSGDQPAEGASSPDGGKEQGKGDGGGSASQPKQPPAPGEKSLRDAAKNQHGAEKNLESGKGKAGQEDQARALADLKRALDELKKEESRIASLPPEEFKKMANKQADTAQRTGDLEQKMEEAGQQSGGEEGEQGGKSGGKGGKQPGKKSVQQAQKNMQDASGDLEKQDPEQAARDQDKAIKELEKALQEIEERLAQLREETQLEKLARLEARFRDMLSRQQVVTKDTLAMDKKREDQGGELKRSDRLAVGKLAGEERTIAELAQQAYDIIYEDGTSVVFPEIVAQVRDDLMAVAQLLDTQKTDTYTQSSQQEIEMTLQELIEALQKAQQQKEGGGGGGGGGGGEEPLLPNSAELKLLRLSQLRVNRRTESFDKGRPKTDLEPVLRQEVMNISQRQAEIADMTIRILERAQQ